MKITVNRKVTASFQMNDLETEKLLGNVLLKTFSSFHQVGTQGTEFTRLEELLKIARIERKSRLSVHPSAFCSCPFYFAMLLESQFMQPTSARFGKQGETGRTWTYAFWQTTNVSVLLRRLPKCQKKRLKRWTITSPLCGWVQRTAGE